MVVSSLQGRTPRWRHKFQCHFNAVQQFKQRKEPWGRMETWKELRCDIQPEDDFLPLFRPGKWHWFSFSGKAPKVLEHILKAGWWGVGEGNCVHTHLSLVNTPRLCGLRRVRCCIIWDHCRDADTRVWSVDQTTSFPVVASPTFLHIVSQNCSLTT